jgi:acyl-coenzyme A thioesterase PaaI-like protein
LSGRAECYRLTRSIAFIDAWVRQDGVEVAVGRSTFARLADDARPEQPGAAAE